MAKSNKGSAWERKIAVFLTNWISGQSKEYYFWRSPGSGSVATINLGNKAISGDIIALKNEATLLLNLCSIECKNGYKDTSLDKHLKYNKSDPLKEFWLQCCNDATKAEKLPMLLYNKHGLKTPWLGINEILFNFCINYLDNLRYIKLKWDNDIQDLYIFDMYEWFNKITPEILKKYSE